MEKFNEQCMWLIFTYLRNLFNGVVYSNEREKDETAIILKHSSCFPPYFCLFAESESAHK